jgi:hypothetical protein
MALGIYDNAYLVHMYTAIARSHPLAMNILIGSEDWLMLGPRRFWIEAVGTEMLFKNLHFGSEAWGNLLASHQQQYEEALAFAPTYARNTDEILIADCMDQMVPYSLWVIMSSQIERERFERIREEALLRLKEVETERADAFLEQYADF